MIYDYLLEIAGNPNVFVDDYENKFRKYYESMDYENFSKKWSITKYLLRDLKKVEKPQYTRLIKISSTWGTPEYNVFTANISPLKRNKELIKLILSITSIWGYKVDIKERRKNVTDAIKNAFQSLESQDIEEYIPKDFKANEIDMDSQYIYIESPYNRRQIMQKGYSKMAIEILVIDVLVY